MQRSREGHIAIVVMDRPEAHKAMNMEMVEQRAVIYDYELTEDDVLRWAGPQRSGTGIFSWQSFAFSERADRVVEILTAGRAAASPL